MNAKRLQRLPETTSENTKDYQKLPLRIPETTTKNTRDYQKESQRLPLVYTKIPHRLPPWLRQNIRIKCSIKQVVSKRKKMYVSKF